MSAQGAKSIPWRADTLWRAGSAIALIAVIEAVVLAVSALPSVVAWIWLIELTDSSGLLRAVVLGSALMPSYMLFALCLMGVSAAATRLTGARTPQAAELRIAEMKWPLLNWARYMTAIRIVRILAGTLFCGSPIWTTYLRLNGARIGRRVYINTLFISDHNLLDIGDDVVIGAEVHLSGHTVEGGVVRTGRVRLHRNVTIGLHSVVDIDVEAGPDTQIGAMSLVPKHTRLEPGGVYAGVPVRRIR
jgi:non-ribosomal peptide synthetase-like protein